MENKNLVIIGLIIIALVIISFAFFQYFINSNTIETEPVVENMPPDEITYPTITPQEVVMAFLTWYTTDDNALPSKLYEDALVLTKNMKEEISRIISTTGLNISYYDSFVCAKLIPDIKNISTDSAQINGKIATVVVNIQNIEENSFIYELALIDGAWKINNVLCFVKG